MGDGMRTPRNKNLKLGHENNQDFEGLPRVPGCLMKNETSGPLEDT